MLIFEKYYKDITVLRVNGSLITEWVKYNLNNGLNVRVDTMQKSVRDKKLVSIIWLKVTPDEINDEFEERLQTLSNLSNKSFTFVYSHPLKQHVQSFKPQDVYERLQNHRL